MIRKLIMQNKVFISIMVILFILFGLVLYFGSNLIYEGEARWRHGNTVAQLLSSKGIIEEIISESGHNLFFLRDLPGTRAYVESNFESNLYQKEEEKIFCDFARVHKEYFQISVFNASGHEISRIYNRQDGTTVIVPNSNLYDNKHRDYFQETMKLEKDQIYASIIDAYLEQKKPNTTPVPVMRFATPLLNSQNEKKGILVLDMYFSKVLKLLPGNIFIQTEEGNIISLKENGSIRFNNSNYVFRERAGWLHLSETETIHYSTVEFLPGKRFIVAIFHSHPLLKAAFRRLIVISVILLAFFLCLISGIGYINISRFMALIGAQKAIIFSLVRLTEMRDQETGYHLERTKNYTVVLAKQLQKNKNYKRILTDKFIDDLYDAAPLHDIGKVGVLDSILLKESKLTDEEYEEMKEHVRIGKQVLQDAIDKYKLKQSFLIIGRNICEYHHEKYNGKGYPYGLKGQQIPLEARIFALCDVYDAIRSKRPYKEAIAHEEAIRRIESGSGEHFDPDIVYAFLKIENEFMEISDSTTS